MITVILIRFCLVPNLSLHKL